jgi:hypothetical protein
MKQMRKAMMDAGASPKSLPPPGSGAAIAPERLNKEQ